MAIKTITGIVTNISSYEVVEGQDLDDTEDQELSDEEVQFSMNLKLNVWIVDMNILKSMDFNGFQYKPINSYAIRNS